MNFKSNLVKFFIFIITLLLAIKLYAVTNRWIFSEIKNKSDEKVTSVRGWHNSKMSGYGFGNMIPLVQASRKVKELEYLHFVSDCDSPQIERHTIRDLIKSLMQERFKLTRYVNSLKTQAGSAVSTKKMRSFSFYLRVIDENIQDLEIILANRVLISSENLK